MVQCWKFTLKLNSQYYRKHSTAEKQVLKSFYLSQRDSPNTQICLPTLLLSDIFGFPIKKIHIYTNKYIYTKNKSLLLLYCKYIIKKIKLEENCFKAWCIIISRASRDPSLFFLVKSNFFFFLTHFENERRAGQRRVKITRAQAGNWHHKYFFSGMEFKVSCSILKACLCLLLG